MNWAISFDQAKMNSGEYFKLDVFLVDQTFDDQGLINKNQTKMQLKPCELENFNENVQKTILALTSNNVSSWLCPLRTDRYFIQGKSSSGRFSYINIEVSACENDSTITCASPEKLDSMFQEANNLINFQFHFINNMININSLSQPMTSFFDDRIYVTINRNLYKEKHYYFTKNTVFTDDNLFQTDYQEEFTTFTYENDQNGMEVDINDNQVFCSIFISSNFISKEYLRSFEKISKFISLIGGVWSIFYTFFDIIARTYNKFRLYVKLANDMFDFSDQNRDFRKKILNFYEKKKKGKTLYTATTAKITESELKNPEKISSLFEEHLNKNGFFKLSKNVKYFFSCLFRKAHEKAMFNLQKFLKKEAFFEINKDLDVVDLLQKLKQIDKLKNLFLNQNQRILFDIPNKVKIALRRTKRRISVEKFQKRLNINSLSIQKQMKKEKIMNENLREMNLYFEAFSEIKDDDKKNQDINEKILKMMDVDLLALFNQIKMPLVSNKSKFLDKFSSKKNPIKE